MQKVIEELQLNLPKVCIEIEEFIRKTLQKMNKDGAVVGLSGGLDSAVTATLTVRSLGKENVHLFNMPERDSKPIHKKHAKVLADFLGVQLRKKSITPIVRAVKGYKLLPIRFVPSRRLRGLLVKFGRSKLISKEESNLLESRLQTKAGSWIARGNAYAVTKHRTRMVVLYQYADVNNLMVVGAANRTEWMTGTFSKWGVDHCSDLMPLLHIYRSQLEQIAEYLEIPVCIRKKYADPDIMPGIDNKGELLGNFTLVDQILVASENGFSSEELYNAYGKISVQQILTLKEYSKQMRESPYHKN